MATYGRSEMATYRRSEMAIARRHVEDIRKRKFSIGEQLQNPLTLDLHNAVTRLSAELYTKDIHFLMELIQNAEDNQYLTGVEPTLEVVLTTEDITGSGALATLLVFNNELGFSKDNIESLCSIGRSTKKGHRNQGFIGEKGIGFKSVFLVSAQPHIFSNGYQVRFNEAPNQDCGIGYIVPEWVAARPAISDLEAIYGSGKNLPTTTIILPLKPEKLETVKKHLSEIHPEVLLFLRKIKRLSVRETGCSTAPDSVSAISISSETSLVSGQTQGVFSYIVHLSVQEGEEGAEAKCLYYIYRQVFPVKPENVVDSRRDLNEWAISLAFPFGQRLKRGTSCVGVFAFLPTAMVTNFPFVVQADFILTSSREAILLDNKWNLGILNHIPSCFDSALMTCVNSTEMVKLYPVARMLEFLPVQESPVKRFNEMRESIKLVVKPKCIVPCESFLTEGMVLWKASDVVRVLPNFRKILSQIKQHQISLSGISCQGKYVLHESMKDQKYDNLLNFLGVPSVNDSFEWCAKCIKACKLVFCAPTKVYLELLCFLAETWNCFQGNTFSSISILKYVAWNGQVIPCSVSQIKQKKEPLRIHLGWNAREHSWLNKWNVEMGCPDNMFFLHDATVTAINGHQKANILTNWLRSTVGLVNTDVNTYCFKLASILSKRKDPKLVVPLAHLAYHSSLKKYIDRYNVSRILQSMPGVDMSGNVRLQTRWLVPASKSIWVKLFDPSVMVTGELELENDNTSNQYGTPDPMDIEGEACYFQTYVELGEVYAEEAKFAGECTPENALLNFLIEHDKATDLPNILPEDRALDVASNQLTSDQALLLLEWIQKLRAEQNLSHANHSSLGKYKIPERFIESIQWGKWMKTYTGFTSPTHCSLYDGTECSTLLDIGKEFKIVSAIDEEYYNYRIKLFKDELKFIGVQIGNENVYQVMVNHLKPLVSSAMRGQLGISLLRFIKYSNDNNKLDVDFLKTLQKGKWLKSGQGFVTPLEAVYLTSDIKEAILQITDLAVVDEIYYGNQIYPFVPELKLLGIKVHLLDVYKLIPEHFKFPDDPSKLKKDAVLLLLKCIRQLESAVSGFTEKIMSQPWMKTTFGFRCPSESIFPDHTWGQFVKVVPLPVIDKVYYGSKVMSFRAELKVIGVAVDPNQVNNMLITKVKILLSASGLTGAFVISLLDCMRCMSKKMPSELSDLKRFLSGEKWLKTHHDNRYASDLILFDSEWETVSQFVDIPRIDNAFYGDRIFSFRDELKSMGVVVDFNEGAHLVARGLQLPKEPESVPPECAFSLLQCARSIRHRSEKSSDKSLLERLLNKLKQSKWLKTYMGYRTPETSLIFNPEWNSHLEEQDGPFIDQGFYGNLSSLYRDELKAIGVKTDTEEVCAFTFQALTSLKETPAIMRTYKFLSIYMKSSDPDVCYTSQLWIPDQEGTEGKWVSNWVCVLHDRDNLFGSCLHILDRHYEKELLTFLSITFGVDPFPTLLRYVDLWKNWVTCNHCVSSAELQSFWGYISENWNPITEKTIRKGLTMLPATTPPGTIQLVVRDEVFIPDDLQLKKSFMEASDRPLFVWFPQNGSSSLTKLYEIYRSLEVQKISEAVEFSVNNCEFEKLGSDDGGLIGKPLIKIVLAFLANPVINMAVEERHLMAKSLLHASIFGTEGAMMVSYLLDLPTSKKKIRVETRKLVLWEKNSQRLLVHKPNWKEGGGGGGDMELISHFARAISEAVLPPNATGLVVDLCRIIKMAMGFSFGFREDQVDSLLATENLELFPVDASFIESAFSAAKASSPSAAVKRQLFCPEFPCTPETSLPKRQRRN